MAIYKSKRLISVFICYCIIITNDLVGIETDVLLNHIRDNEQKIDDIQTHYTVHIIKDASPAFLWYDNTWGYAQGREYMEGLKYGANDDGSPKTIYEYFAFDGKKEYVLRDIKSLDENHPMKVTGGLYSFRPFDFSVDFTPHSLLGYSLVQDAQESLSESLSKADLLSVRDEMEEIQGHKCFVLEVIGLRTEGKPYNHLVWIDPQRGYRPLQMEIYHQEKGFGPWASILNRTSNIKLENINGIWFPTSAEKDWYLTELRPPEGMTKDEYVKKYSHLPGNERYKDLRIETSYNEKYGKRVITIDKIRINEGIPEDKFRIEFPYGCTVWDDFAQIGYTVGGSKISTELPDANNNIKSGEQFNELKVKSKVNQEDLPTVFESAPNEMKNGPVLEKSPLADIDNNNYWYVYFLGALVLVILGFWGYRRYLSK